MFEETGLHIDDPDPPYLSEYEPQEFAAASKLELDVELDGSFRR